MDAILELLIFRNNNHNNSMDIFLIKCHQCILLPYLQFSSRVVWVIRASNIQIFKELNNLPDIQQCLNNDSHCHNNNNKQQHNSIRYSLVRTKCCSRHWMDRCWEVVDWQEILAKQWWWWEIPNSLAKGLIKVLDKHFSWLI